MVREVQVRLSGSKEWIAVRDCELGGGADVGELVDGQVVLGGSGGPAYVAPQGTGRDDWLGILLERRLSG